MSECKQEITIIDNGPDYEAWLAANSKGYVANIKAGFHPDFFTVHLASCKKITPGPKLAEVGQGLRSSYGKDTNPGLKGKSFCFTGAFRRIDPGTERRFIRKQVEQMVEATGGRVLTTVGTQLDYLVMTDPDSSTVKARKARELEVHVLSEEEFFALLRVPISQGAEVPDPEIGKGAASPPRKPRPVSVAGKPESDAAKFVTGKYRKVVCESYSGLSIWGHQKGYTHRGDCSVCLCRTTDSGHNLKMPVSILRLSYRLQHCLELAPVFTVGELTELSKAQLYKLPGFDLHSVDEIQHALEEVNLELADAMGPADAAGELNSPEGPDLCTDYLYIPSSLRTLFMREGVFTIKTLLDLDPESLRKTSAGKVDEVNQITALKDIYLKYGIGRDSIDTKDSLKLIVGEDLLPRPESDSQCELDVTIEEFMEWSVHEHFWRASPPLAHDVEGLRYLISILAEIEMKDEGDWEVDIDDIEEKEAEWKIKKIDSGA